MSKKSFKPRVIICDMDGVIVDSMPYHFISWYEALKPFGVRVSCFDIYLKEGESWEKSLKDFLKKAGIKPEFKILKKIFKLRERLFKKYFKRFIFPDARDFLHCLKAQKYSLALVTGTPMQEVKRILPRDIFGMFDCVVSGDSLKKGKPHPQPYLKAAACLGVRPKDCLVIENAPLGVESAKRAGMFCVALTTSLPRQYLNKADVVVDDFKDIIKLYCK